MKRLNVIITENIAHEGIDILKKDPEVEVDMKIGIKQDELKKIIGQYDAIITRSGTHIPSTLIENPGRLKIIGRAGVGVDNINIEAASKKGIIVLNTPTGNTLAATELTMGIMLAAATQNMISAKEISLMKDNVIFVNCARGGIVNENDLYEALKSGKVFAAGVDVFEKEPPESNKLLELENAFATPHIGANTMEGQEAVSVIIAEQVLNALHGRPYLNAVNIPFMKSQLPEHVQRYFNLTEKMGKLAAQVTRGRPEKITIVMVGKNFEEDLCERKFDVPFSYQPFTIAGLKGFLEVSMKETVTHINAPYIAKDRNIVVEESKTDQFDKFNDLIIFIVKTDKTETSIGGTVFPDKLGRIVLLDRFHLDVVPEGTFLNFRIFDRPGVIGKVATILGDHHINISGLGLSRQKTGEEVAFVAVDDPIGKEVLVEIQRIDGMIEAQTIDL